jgi:hypothetical protein
MLLNRLFRRLKAGDGPIEHHSSRPRRDVYTDTARLPIEADGRPRYLTKSKTENVERVVTEEQISPR